MAKSFQTHCGCCGGLHQLYFGMYVMFFSLVRPETKNQIFCCHLNLKIEEEIWHLLYLIWNDSKKTSSDIWYLFMFFSVTGWPNEKNIKVLKYTISLNILTTGGPRISWFLVPKGYYEIRGSRILKPFLVLNSKLGPNFF